jgi:hypothetical protein
MSWITDNKGQAPWKLAKQPNKLGYMNNPRWTQEATPKHNPCGYWRKADKLKVTIIGTPWPKKEWYWIAMSSTGQYQSATTMDSSGRIYVSSDYGLTWEEKGHSAAWLHIYISSSGQYQLVSEELEKGIWLSSDYGQTWVQTTLPGHGHGAAFSLDGRYQIITAWNFTVPENQWSIFISSDYGQTWVYKLDRLDSLYSVVSSSGQYQMVAYDYLNKLFISSDYGQTWNNVGISGSTFNRENNPTLSTDGQHQSYPSGNAWGYIQVSNNYGETWTNTIQIGVWEKMVMSSDGSYQLCYSNDGKVYCSIDFGVSWSYLSDLPIASTKQNKVVSSSNAQYITFIGGTLVIEEFCVSSDYGATWSKNGLSKRWKLSMMSSNGQYQTAIQEKNDYIYFSSDYGETWATTSPDRVEYIKESTLKINNAVWPMP